MGLRGPPPKDPTRRQRRNKPATAELRLATEEPDPGDEGQAAGAAVVVLEPPQLPKHVLAVTRDRWADFWRSPLAKLVDPATDLLELERLFLLYDERERAYRKFRRKRYVEGSTGQPVLSPSWRIVQDCDQRIAGIVDKFGLTAIGRLKLGIKLGAAKRAIDELNEMEADDDDPR